MKHALIWTISTAVLMWTGTAQAASPKLKGEYVFTGAADCIASATPFNSNLTPTSFTVGNSFSVVGIRTFNGDGTGTIKGSSASITPPPVTNTATTPPSTPLGGISAGGTDFTAKFTYSVDEDGFVTTDLVIGSLQGTNTSGPGVGSTFAIDGFTLAGMVSTNKQMIALATVTPKMETMTVTPAGGGSQFNRYRICHRSRILIRTGEGRNDD